ncbi:MAG: protein kinase [Chloroflexi bacterium]|nr:protein kinase [Chloroflexota bacterium]
MLIGSRYNLTEQIGAGGMGTVYRALDVHSGQTVAVKMLKSEALARDPHILQRFMREAEALRQLDHPNIVAVLETIEDRGQHYIAMEYVSGGSLRQLLDSEGHLPLKRALEITLDLADALTRAHRLQIVHRDIKPANVLIAEDGTPRLTDFGVAHIGTAERVTQTGVTIGTPDYMSPEALSGEPIDVRTDLWALGVLLFEMLAGERPFDGSTPAHVIVQVMTQTTPDLEALRPDVPVELIDLIYRMLVKDPAERISSVRLVGAEIEALLHGTPVETTNVLRVKAGTTPYQGRNDTPNGAANPDGATQFVERRFATPTPSGSSVPHNLPAQTTPFVGRIDELTELQRMLLDSRVRLVTIVAAGGMGKTRLGQETAASLLDHFPNGVYFVPLAPIKAADNIVPAIAEAIDFKFRESGRTQKQQLLDYLRSRRTLLVLDNFEHLLSGAPLVSEMLEAAPDMQVLVTTRERLNLTGETLFYLEGMDFPDWEPPEDALEYSAIKLFLLSARRIRPDFELTIEDLPHVTRISRLVLGMPLGVLLAASWVEMLSLREIAEEISSSLDFLESDLRDLPERHRSIRAVFEYSWSLLNEAERDTYMKLSMFRGGFTRQAAQAVTGASLRTLTALANKSLLRRDADTGRYEVHELLRQYAEEALERTGQLDAACAAHSRYYIDFMRQRGPELKGRRQLDALNEIEIDFENVRAALLCAVEDLALDALHEIMEPLLWFCLYRNRYEELHEMHAKLLELVSNRQDAASQQLLGRLLIRLHDPKPGDRAQIERGLALLEPTADQTELGMAYRQLAFTYVHADELQEGMKYLQMSLSLAEAVGDPFYIGRLLDDIGFVYGLMNQPERRKEFAQRSYDIRQQIGDRLGVARALINLGGEAYVAGRFDEARDHLEHARAVYLEMGDRQGVAYSDSNLGGLALYMADLDRAQGFAEDTLANIDRQRNPSATGAALAVLGAVAAVNEEYERGLEIFEEVMSVAGIDFDMRCIAHFGLSGAHAGLGDFDKAAYHLREMIQIGLKMMMPQLVLTALPMAPMVLLARGMTEKAVEVLGAQVTHPSLMSGWIDSLPLLARTEAQLRAEVAPEVFNAAFARGQQADVMALARQLVSDFE